MNSIGPRVSRSPTTLRPAGFALLATALSIVAGLAPTSSARAAEGCPNEALRTGYSAALPDCRAYELVSPPGVQPHFETFYAPAEKNVTLGSAVPGSALGVTASRSSTDSGISFFSTFAPPGSLTDGPVFLSSRGQTGWGTENLIPPVSTGVTAGCLPYMIDWSADLERGVLAAGYFTPGHPGCAEEPELVAGEPRGVQNLFLRDSATGTFQLIDQGPVGQDEANAVYQAGSSDLGVVAFSEEKVLNGEERSYYVWGGGTIDRLLTVLPDGQATGGEIVDAVGRREDATSPTYSHAVAPDGSRIEFTAGGDLYSRLNPAAAQSALGSAGECTEAAKACTVQLDATETSEPGGGGEFAEAGGPEGSVVYFTDVARLTSDSTAAAGEPDLYEYDFHAPAGERLSDLSVDQNPGEHADLLGFVGTNESGSPGDYAYFVADGVLAANRNSSGAVATPGSPNLYLRHDGTNDFIATLLGDPFVGGHHDSCDWENRCLTSRVSPNGRYLGFNSFERLTGFDNTPAEPEDCRTAEGPGPCQEIFLYDAQAATLNCASCGSTGAEPIAPASIKLPVGRSVPHSPFPYSLQRNVSDEGQVFFDTPDPLTGAVRNGHSSSPESTYLGSNVYEYQGGELSLLSSGTSESPSYFYDASSDGGDVYLITAQALTPGAPSSEFSIYDAKADGGLPADTPSGPQACSGEECRGASISAPSPPPTPGSALLGGRGNAPRHTAKPRAGRLSKALKACRRHQRKRKPKAMCEKAARKKYGRAK